MDVNQKRSDLALPHSPLRSHDEVAKIMSAAGEHMTRQAVAKTEQIALRKLRAAFALQGLYFDDLNPRG